MKIVEKLWGKEEIIVNNELYCAKFLILNPGFESSYHYHPLKDETFHVLEGVCLLNLNGKELVLCQGNTIRIAPTIPHSFCAMEKRPCRILEVSTPHSDEDVVRLRESREI